MIDDSVIRTRINGEIAKARIDWHTLDDDVKVICSHAGNIACGQLPTMPDVKRFSGGQCLIRYVHINPDPHRRRIWCREYWCD